METVKDCSYGVIPVINIDGAWEVFIINQISYQSNIDTYWTFPKGHAEDNETQEETALRELSEESSIELSSLDTTRTFDQEYTFKTNEQLIEKSVFYYIGYAKNKSFSVQSDEIKEGQWCLFKNAQSQLSHDIAKKLLDEVQEYLHKTHLIK